MENYTTKYDEALGGISHYQKYPKLLPFIGSNYDKRANRILIVGESHYLPKDTKVDLLKWYDSDESSLSEEDKNYIDVRGLLTYAIRSNYKADGHTIFRNIESAALEIDFKSLNDSHFFSNVAFFNFYQRPAENTGDSIIASQIDKGKGAEIFRQVTDIVNPTHIIFVSSKVRAEFTDEDLCDYYCGHTPHPAMPWWNRKSERYGNITGKEKFQNFLKEHELLG